MAATIKDIARKLNISTSTVSYALNGGPRPVPEEVRIKVLETAKELQYRPNRLARSLITRRSHTIGVVPTSASINLAYTPYFQGVVNGLLNEAEQLAQDVLVFTRYDSSNPEALVDSLLDGRVDGLVFLAPVHDSPVLKLVEDSSIPFVILSGEHPTAPVFMTDNAGGTWLAVQHLASLGHRSIAHITGSRDMVDGIERREAFYCAMQRLDLPVAPDWVVEGSFTVESGYDAAITLFDLSSRPTAIFCANDEMAAGVVRAAWEHGIRVPEDLSVVGFDNAPSSSYILPNLTTVSQPWEDMATEALRTLVRLIEGLDRAEGSQFNTQLIVRSSTTRPMEDTKQ